MTKYIEAGRLRRAALEATISVPTSQAVEHEATPKQSVQGLVFDHVHLLSRDPKATGSWYVDKLGGKSVGSEDVAGAPQVYVRFGEALVTIRGQRTGEEPAAKPGLQWGMDHFGVRIDKDFENFCDGLKSSGVKFLMDPTNFGDEAEVAYIEDPDGVKIELVFLK